MKEIKTLNVLHVFNDGFQASFLLMLPFIAKDLGLNLTRVGFLGTSMNILQMFLALPAGYVALRIGGIKLLTIATLLYGLGYLGSSFASGYLILIPAFLIAGVGFGIFHPVAFALVAKKSDKKTRGKEMGNFTAIGDVGRIGISAGVTFLITIIGWRLSAAMFAFISVMIYLILNKLNNSRVKAKDDLEEVSIDVKLSDFLRNKRFLLSSLTGTLDSFASSSLFVFLPFLLIKRGVNPAILGTFTAAFFVGNLLGKTLLGRFVDKYENDVVFIISELLMASFIFILANSISFPLIIAASIVLGIFTKGTVPVVQTMISESIEHHGNFEKGFGVYSVIVGIAVALSPVTLGYFSDVFGIVSAFNISALFALMAIIPALAFKFTR